MTTAPVANLSRPSVRRARRADWAVARALLDEIDKLHAGIAPDYFRRGTRLQTDWHRLLDDPHAAVFVAELSPTNEVAGILIVRVYDTPVDPGMLQRRRSHIETLVVAARRRRCGIGRLLMSEATAWARVRGAVEVVLTSWAGNREADAFYERLGYRVLSRVLHAPI